MTNEQIYRKWDEKLKQKHPDYDQIEKELLDAWMVDQNQPEIFWRLGSVVYSMSLDLFDTEEIKKKTIEAFRYVEKALKLFEENHLESFEAFKWSSITSGKLALIETDIEEKIKYLLTKCLFVPEVYYNRFLSRFLDIQKFFLIPSGNVSNKNQTIN